MCYNITPDETSDTSEETCTGDFEDKGRPPAGTKCARTCIYVGKGYYYGSSYCYTNDIWDDGEYTTAGLNWGATCKSPKGNNL